jgi:hypothetical protein
VLFRRRRKPPRSSARLARLRIEYADLYPRVRPERWLPVRKLVRRFRDRGFARALQDEHFDFRGGVPPRNPAWPDLRQRVDDPPVRHAWNAPRRETRLKHDDPALDAGLPPGIWLSARETSLTLYQRREDTIRHSVTPNAPVLRDGERLLPDSHFEFRGGASEPGLGRLRTRRADSLDQEAREGEFKVWLRGTFPKDGGDRPAP